MLMAAYASLPRDSDRTLPMNRGPSREIPQANFWFSRLDAVGLSDLLRILSSKHDLIDSQT